MRRSYVLLFSGLCLLLAPARPLRPPTKSRAYTGEILPGARAADLANNYAFDGLKNRIYRAAGGTITPFCSVDDGLMA